MYKKIDDDVLLLLLAQLGELKSGNLYSIVYSDGYTLTNLGLQLTSYLTNRCRYRVYYGLMDNAHDNCEANRNNLFYEYFYNVNPNEIRLLTSSCFHSIDIDDIYDVLQETEDDIIIVDGFRYIEVSERIRDNKYEYITKRLKALAVEKRVRVLLLNKTIYFKTNLEDEGVIILTNLVQHSYNTRTRSPIISGHCS